METGSTTTTEELRDLTAALELGEPRVQEAGNTDPERRTFLVALPLQPGEGTVGEEANQTARQTMETALTSVEGLEIRGTTVIGGAVSRELVVTGFVAIGVALFLMLVYIWFRFGSLRYSLCAIGFIQ